MNYGFKGVSVGFSQERSFSFHKGALERNRQWYPPDGNRVTTQVFMNTLENIAGMIFRQKNIVKPRLVVEERCAMCDLWA